MGMKGIWMPALALAGLILVVVGLWFFFFPTDPPETCPCGGRVHPKAFWRETLSGATCLSLCCWPARFEHRSVPCADDPMVSIREPNWICTSCGRAWTFHETDCENYPAAGLWAWARRLRR
jgi:hypothetical protein